MQWHQGFFTYDYTPVSLLLSTDCHPIIYLVTVCQLARGYDSSIGFLVGGEDHYTQNANWSVNCPETSIDIWNSTQPAFGRNGTYNGYTFTQRAVDLIDNHNTGRTVVEGQKHPRSSGCCVFLINFSVCKLVMRLVDEPLFIYHALHNTHGPIEAPEQ